MYFIALSSSKSDENTRDKQKWEDYDEYQKDLWNNDPVVYVPEEAQQMIKDHPGFSAPPIGPIADCIVSDQLLNTVPQSFAASYIVNCLEDARIMRELISARGDPQPIIIVYPHQLEMYTTVDENITVDTVSIASLKCENPTIANLVIDYFGTTKGM